MISLLVSIAAKAQTPLPQKPAVPEEYRKVIADYEAAAAAARRPGDESLSCEAIQTELQATLTSPAIQEYYATAGVAAQRDMAEVQMAQAAMPGVQPPDAARPGQPAATSPAVDAQTAQAAASKRIEDHARQVEQLAAVMPMLMRSQRLTELAVLKACGWLTDAGYESAMPVH